MKFLWQISYPVWKELFCVTFFTKNIISVLKWCLLYFSHLTKKSLLVLYRKYVKFVALRHPVNILVSNYYGFVVSPRVLTQMFSIFQFQTSYSTAIQIKFILFPGPLNDLRFLLTFINILKYFNVTCLPLFTPISLTNILSRSYNKFSYFLNK